MRVMEGRERSCLFISQIFTRATLASAGRPSCRRVICLSVRPSVAKRRITQTRPCTIAKDSIFLLPEISAKVKRGSPATEAPNAGEID